MSQTRFGGKVEFLLASLSKNKILLIGVKENLNIGT